MLILMPVQVVHRMDSFDLLAGITLPAHTSTVAHVAGTVWLGDERGRE